MPKGQRTPSGGSAKTQLARSPDTQAGVSETRLSVTQVCPDPRVRAFLEGRRAPSTRRAHEHHWASWVGWCLRLGLEPLPTSPRALVEWIVGAADSWGLAKVEGTLAAVAYAHRLAGHDPPPTAHAIVRDALRALRRKKGTAPANPRDPAALGELRRMLGCIDRSSLTGQRDAALLLLGWWAALRRSEIVALEGRDLKEAPGGIAIMIRKSKTDQEGRGETIGLERKGGDLCPVEAIEAWITASGITAGSIFRGITRYGTLRKAALSDQHVNLLISRLARAAELPRPERFGGHSLRAGFVTEAYRQGVPEAQIMATTRHRSVAMLARYRREADPVRASASIAIKVE